MLVDFLKHRYQLLHESIALLVDKLAVNGHLLLPDFQELHVGLLFHLQQRIALEQRLVVAVERLDIGIVVLGDDHIHQLPALFASSLDEQGVAWRNEDEGYQSDMLRQPLVFLFVALEMLLRTPFHSAIDRGGIQGIIFVETFQHEEVLVVADDLGINGRIGAVAERQVIDGIQQIRLALAVMADKTVNLRRQLQRCLPDVLIVEDGYFLQYHECKITSFPP